MKKKQNEAIRMTKKRLRAYPLLKANIKRYELDIEDLKKEKGFEKSKSIVIVQPTYREPLSEEDKRAARIKTIEEQIKRDTREIEEIERALEEIKKDEFYSALELFFFKGMNREQVAVKVHSSGATISRQIGRLLNWLSVYWYGAAALY